MANMPPSYHTGKQDFPDSMSDRTYTPNTAYNIELNNLRDHIPNQQPIRPHYTGSGYDPRYDSINNAPPARSSASERRLQKVFATMCCGSCFGLLAWVVLVSLIVAGSTFLIVKVVVRHRLMFSDPS